MIHPLKLLDWSDALHARWEDWLRKADPDLLRTNFEASFRTPLGILTHVANVENAWMDVALGEKPDWARHSTKEWTELDPVLAYAKETRSRTRKILEDLGERGLAKECGPVEGDFAKKTFTVAELLFTVVTHEQAHRGELIACFWSKDVPPPVVDYPAYGTPLG